MLFRSELIEKNIEESLALIKSAAELDHPDAQATLALYQLQGAGIPQNTEEALETLHELAESGNAKAQANLGVLYYNGMHVKQDKDIAFKWLTASSEQNNVHGQYNLAVYYYQKEPISHENYKEAVRLFELAAKNGKTEAKEILTKLNKTNNESN